MLYFSGYYPYLVDIILWLYVITFFNSLWSSDVNSPINPDQHQWGLEMFHKWQYKYMFTKICYFFKRISFPFSILKFKLSLP